MVAQPRCPWRRGFFCALRAFARLIADLVKKSASAPGARIRLHSRAMSPARKSHPLSRAEARRIWLRAQRLDTPAPFADGAQATPAPLEHLGIWRIDTINAIGRPR